MQDALLACLTVEQDDEFSEWMDAAARHLPDLADELISLAIDLRGQPKLCRRASGGPLQRWSAFPRGTATNSPVGIELAFSVGEG